MRKLMTTLVAVAAVGCAWAKSVEQVSVVENEIATISVPFGIKNYMPSNKEVVRIEEISGTSLRITALKRGRCDLEVHGDKDLVQKYEITVLGDLATTLDTLTTELDQVQEVRARIVGDFIRVDGELSSIPKWEYLQKVLRNYPDVVHNFAVFNPGPDVMLRLKETLQEAGFTVSFQPLGKERKKWPANTISLVINKQTRIMTIQGRVYTPAQVKAVEKCLASERWLALDIVQAGEGAKANEFQIRRQFDVFVDNPQIRVSVAYMAIGDTDLKELGNKYATDRDTSPLNISGLLSSLGGVLKERGEHHTHYGSQAASYGATLDVVGKFLKKNNISRVSRTGYTTMESWNDEVAQFKSGGTRFIPIQGVGGGGSTLEKIPYGFIMKTKGGLVPTGDSVDLAFDFEYSVIANVTDRDYDRREEVSKQNLILPLGRTSFISGIKMIDEDRLSPSGLPFLRNTPMLNWFVADSGTELNDRRLVIMVCPEIVDNTMDKTLEVEKEINIPVPTEGAKPTEQREDEKMPFSGGQWNPLNWFRM